MPVRVGLKLSQRRRRSTLAPQHPAGEDSVITCRPTITLFGRLVHSCAPPPAGENSIIIVGGANTSEEWQITDEVTQVGRGWAITQGVGAIGGSCQGAACS